MNNTIQRLPLELIPHISFLTCQAWYANDVGGSNAGLQRAVDSQLHLL